jgi:L-malate glycosyltransferase
MESFAALRPPVPAREAVTPCGRPIRVLHVASGDLWAGAEAQIYTLLRTLKSHASGMQVAAVLMNNGELAVRLRDCGVDVYTFNEGRIGTISILRNLRRLMRAWRPDIVHTHRTKENILGALANRMACSAPSVRTVHGASERSRKGMRGLRETLISRVDLWCARNLQQRVIAVSAELGQHLAATLPAERIAVIENGVDIAETRSRIQPVDFRIRMSDRVHVGLVGRLVPVKRVDMFIKMAAVLQRRHGQMLWHFHVFGDGPLRGTLEAQAKLEEGVNVTFHGHRSDIIACLAGLDVLVICSDHEGLPMAALESLAVGTRIAAHAVGGLPDALAGTRSARLVHEHDPDAYAEAVWNLLSSRIDAMDNDAVAERVSAARNAERTYALYCQLLGVKPQGMGT